MKNDENDAPTSIGLASSVFAGILSPRSSGPPPVNPAPNGSRMNASMKSRIVSSKSIKRLASIGEAVPDASGYEYAGGNTKGSLIPRFFRITGVRDPGAAAADDSLAIPRIGSFPPPAAARTAPTGVFFFALLVAIRIVSRPSIIVVPFLVVVVVVARNAAIIIIG